MFFTAKQRKYRKVYNEHYLLVLNILNSRVKNHQDAEDLCHEIFVTLYNKFDEIENYTSWIKGCLRNKLFNYYRAQQKSKKDIALSELENESLLLEPAEETDEMIMIIREALENRDNFRSEKEQTILYLVAIKQYSYEDVASELKLSYRQVEYAYNRAVKQLMLYLKNKGITAKDVL